MAGKTKKELAIEFISNIRSMEPSSLHALIRQEAGEELAEFFLTYSANLMTKEPSKIIQNTSTLMLMGYLIRQHEETSKGPPKSFQCFGLA